MEFAKRRLGGRQEEDREGAGDAVELPVGKLRKSLRVRHADLGVGDSASPDVSRRESDHLLG